MNIYRTKNVFIGLNQGESAYWQVNAGNTVINPAPWTNSLLPGEPDFSWCGASDAAVRICFPTTLSRRLNACAHLFNMLKLT